MKLAIASDHAGFDLKEAIAVGMGKKGHEIQDLGTHSRAPVDYPDIAETLCLAVRSKRAERGILICGSGVGASVAANKIPGIRAGLCHDTYSAHQGVEHDDMNVLVLGARVIAYELARELVEHFMKASFMANEERLVRRVEKIKAIENKYRGDGAIDLAG